MRKRKESLRAKGPKRRTQEPKQAQKPEPSGTVQTKPSDKQGSPKLAYTTNLGRAYQGDSKALLLSKAIAPASVDLLIMSPPFALTRRKDYGNETEHRYVR